MFMQHIMTHPMRTVKSLVELVTVLQLTAKLRRMVGSRSDAARRPRQPERRSKRKNNFGSAQVRFDARTFRAWWQSEVNGRAGNERVQIAHDVGYGGMSHFRLQKISHRVRPVENRELDDASRLLQVLASYFREWTRACNARETCIAEFIPAAGVEDLRVQSRAPLAVRRARGRAVTWRAPRIPGLKRLSHAAHIGRGGAFDLIADAHVADRHPG